MADREPRRRKRRKELQKRDDNRSDDLLLPPSFKSDSDQEIEDHEREDHHTQTGSNLFSKIIFFILFSGLLISMGFILISLQNASKGPVDLFEASHVQQEEASQHDSHLKEAFQDNPESHPQQLEDQGDGGVSFENLFESGVSTLSSFFSTNEEGSVAEEDQVLSSVTESNEAKSDIGDDKVERVTGNDEVESVTGNNEAESDIGNDKVVSVAGNDEVESLTKDDEEEVSTRSDNIMVDFADEPMEQSTTEAPPDSSTSPVDVVHDNFSPSKPEDSSFAPTPSSDFELPHQPDEAEHFKLEPQREEELYENADITNENDYEIRDELDDLQRVLEKSPERALAKSRELLKRSPSSPRALYLQADALDKLAEKQRSNKLLEEAITAYQGVLALEGVPRKLYMLAGRRAADRMRFRGFTGKSVRLLTEMSKKFPEDIDLKNEVAVGYLLIGQNIMAKNVLLDVLKHKPDSGFAKVHLGFILKTEDKNYEEGVKYLREGIASQEPGVIDGRFYFHLGDALHRLGKNEEAKKVYEEAVGKGLFLSVYQRSLYNVDGLTGKPWWDPHSTPYAPDFKILERNWQEIRDEAVSLIDERYAGFLPEAEGLQERGDWKQLELFARGRKLDKNCQRAPRTCAIVSQIPDAASCKRGQVKFSIMHPQTHVWAHTGPTNCRLRAHLGLVVPENVFIRVAEQKRKWEEGKVILFDDSFEHEVWHNGTSYRLVLIVDFWHPELTAYQKRSLSPI